MIKAVPYVLGIVCDLGGSIVGGDILGVMLVGGAGLVVVC